MSKKKRQKKKNKLAKKNKNGRASKEGGEQRGEGAGGSQSLLFHARGLPWTGFLPSNQFIEKAEENTHHSTTALDYSSSTFRY